LRTTARRTAKKCLVQCRPPAVGQGLHRRIRDEVQAVIVDVIGAGPCIDPSIVLPGIRLGEPDGVDFVGRDLELSRHGSNLRAHQRRGSDNVLSEIRG